MRGNLLRDLTYSLQVSFGGTIAYCPQTAWLANATLQDNILFGSAMDEAR